ncbi:MAG: thermonuclease family protein, partial [Rhodospirillales bacterium]|nr:thermonuclease family protein [Rhodospirillales bacterium]
PWVYGPWVSTVDANPLSLAGTAISPSLPLRLFFTAVLIAALFTFLSVRGDMRPQARIEGRADVIDGDTITVAGATVRLYGVDAPEPAQRCDEAGRDWACGQAAAAALAGHLRNRVVACEERAYGGPDLMVATCVLGGQDIAAWLARSGWAMAYVKFSKRYIPEEAVARARGVGLWKGQFEPPWDWRRARRR